jgi:NhaP-type Na+/H+ or K+/H+ antiporter
MGIIGILALVCAIYVIYDVWNDRYMPTNTRLLWTIMALLFNIITAVIYLIQKKK